MKFRSFTEAGDYVHNLKLKSVKEWRSYCKSGNKPHDIPANPERVYKKEWKGLGDWLGTDRIATKDIQYRPFEEPRDYVRKLGLKSQKEWFKYYKSDKIALSYDQILDKEKQREDSFPCIQQQLYEELI